MRDARLLRKAESMIRRHASCARGADCLETFEEINITNRERFIEAGGRDFHYIPCLNDAPAWGSGLAAIVRRELSGWM